MIKSAVVREGIFFFFVIVSAADRQNEGEAKVEMRILCSSSLLEEEDVQHVHPASPAARSSSNRRE